MKALIFSALAVAAVAAALTAGCSSDPCADLQGYGETCADQVAKDRAIAVAAAGDKDQCRLYRDAWIYEFQPRCDSAADGGTADAALPLDSGTPDTGAPDAGTDGAGATDDAAVTDDAGAADSGSDI